MKKPSTLRQKIVLEESENLLESTSKQPLRRHGVVALNSGDIEQTEYRALEREQGAKKRFSHKSRQVVPVRSIDLEQNID